MSLVPRPCGSVVILLLSASLALADDARVRELIRQLAADDPSLREAATEELQKLGDADGTGSVERLLTEASHDPDAERSARCRQILSQLHWLDHTAVINGMALDLNTNAVLWTVPCSTLLGVRRKGSDSVAWYDVNDEAVECVNLRDGKPTWVLHDHSGVRVVKEEYLLACHGTSFSRVSLETGGCLWTTDVSDIVPSPHSELRSLEYIRADEDLVWLGADSTCAIDAKTGHLRWLRKGLKAWRTLIHSDGLFSLVWDSQKTPCLHRLDRRSGDDVWQVPLSHFDCPDCVLGTPRECGLVLVSGFVGAGGSATEAIETATGKVRWTLEGTLARACSTEPNGACAWIADSSKIAVVDLANGSIVQQFSVPGYAEDFLWLVDGPRLFIMRSHCQHRLAYLCGFDVRARKSLGTVEVPRQVAWVSGTEYFNSPSLDRIGSHLLVVDEVLWSPKVYLIDISDEGIARGLALREASPLHQR